MDHSIRNKNDADRRKRGDEARRRSSTSVPGFDPVPTYAPPEPSYTPPASSDSGSSYSGGGGSYDGGGSSGDY